MIVLFQESTVDRQNFVRHSVDRETLGNGRHLILDLCMIGYKRMIGGKCKIWLVQGNLIEYVLPEYVPVYLSSKQNLKLS